MEQIIIPRRIYRSFVQQHPEWIFVYSADVLRKGFFGQMYECHGEPNAYPVSVRYSGCKSSGYFNDFEPMYKDCVDTDIYAILGLNEEKPIIILPNIGRGHSQMEYFAPKLFRHLHRQLDILRYPNIKIDYTT